MTAGHDFYCWTSELKRFKENYLLIENILAGDGTICQNRVNRNRLSRHMVTEKFSVLWAVISECICSPGPPETSHPRLNT